jgi:rRNA processing protein Krr1/Pno1
MSHSFLTIVSWLIDRNVHILGSVQNIKIARDAVVSLILGSPPGMSPPSHLQNVADSPRKGLRSFEICWSETQAAILEHFSGYRFGVYVLIFGFWACSNDYLQRRCDLSVFITDTVVSSTTNVCVHPSLMLLRSESPPCMHA